MFEQVRMYCQPVVKESKSLTISVAESPVDAVKRFVSTNTDEFYKTNRDSILQRAQEILQKSGVI
jgi:hypothetical protein